MKPLSLDIINASAPYEVYWHETSRTYRFKSDFGVVLAIGFDDDDIIENAESYVFSIINVNKTPSPRDFKMRDTVTCIIGNRLEPYYFKKAAEEGKRYTIDEARFSYSNGLCHVKQSRTKDGKIERSEYSDSRCIYDMLSILAQARSFDPTDYKVGQRIQFPMTTGRKVEEQTLIFRGRKSFTAENDTTYRCLVFSLVEYKKGKEKEVITFYITDDKNHLPVRLDLYLNFGSAKAFLSSVRGNRHPLTSIVTK